MPPYRLARSMCHHARASMNQYSRGPHTSRSVALKMTPATISPSRRRALRDGLIVAGVIFNATLLLVWGPRLYWFIDALAWWHIDLANLYGGMHDPGLIGAFRYAPVIAWLFVPAS